MGGGVRAAPSTILRMVPLPTSGEDFGLGLPIPGSARAMALAFCLSLARSFPSILPRPLATPRTDQAGVDEACPVAGVGGGFGGAFEGADVSAAGGVVGVLFQEVWQVADGHGRAFRWSCAREAS